MITTADELKKNINVLYTLSSDNGHDEKWFKFRYEVKVTGRWSYFIQGCTVDGWEVRYLDNVPRDRFKHWIITKSSTHLKVVCNKVTVLKFNFLTDCDADKKDGEKVWSRKAKSFQFNNIYQSLMIKTSAS